MCPFCLHAACQLHLLTWYRPMIPNWAQILLMSLVKFSFSHNRWHLNERGKQMTTMKTTFGCVVILAINGLIYNAHLFQREGYLTPLFVRAVSTVNLWFSILYCGFFVVCVLCCSAVTAVHFVTFTSLMMHLKTIVS